MCCNFSRDMGKKVNLNSVIALRNECDEHLAAAFIRLGYTESFTLQDTRLAIGYGCVVLAGIMYWMDKKYNNNFNDSTYVAWTEFLVASFFLLEGVWWLYSKYVEKQIKYVGTKGAKTLKVSTHVDSTTEPVYYMDFDLDGTTDAQNIEFAKVFREDGFLEFNTFAEILDNEVKGLEKKA